MNTFNIDIPTQDDYKKGLVTSLGFHIAVVLIFTLKTVFFSGEALNYETAIRVDLVALPDKVASAEPPPLTPETKAPEAKSPPKPEPTKAKAEPKTPAVPVLDFKQKQKAALSKLKEMDALENLKNEVQKENKASSAAPTKKTGEVKYKGNILSPGTEITGLNKLQHEEYIALLDRHIKENWTLPEWLSKKNLKAQIRVRIDDKGHIISKQLVKSSGNPAYDDSVKATIEKSEPFPVPPEKFSAVVSVNGILIGFPE